MFAQIYSHLSPRGPRAALSILIFHRVLPAPDALFPQDMHAARFEQLCGWLARWFRVMPLDVAARRLAEGNLPPRAAAITFDDGYADNHDVAWPILRRHGLPATFFIATGYLDGGRMWNDTVIESVRRCKDSTLDLGGIEGATQAAPGGRLAIGTLPERRTAIEALLGALKYLPPEVREASAMAVASRTRAGLPSNLMLASAQVQAMHRGGLQIGAHTVGHPILARLAPAAARAEIAGSRDRLEALLQDRVGLFAYPNGKPGKDYAPEHVAMVRELGFDTAVSTAWGAATGGSDPLQLPRFTPWDKSRLGFGLRLARNLRDARRAA